MDDKCGKPMNPDAHNSLQLHDPGSILVVAHTPGIPALYKGLLKNISFLLPCDNKGKSYKCSSNEKDTFLIRSKADKCLFFEWEEKEERMVCWMYDIPRNIRMKFLVNPAIVHGINDVSVKLPAIAFSSDFDGDGSWACVKSMLIAIFGSSKKADSTENDHLYVFTRIGSSLCFRNFKIDGVPENIDSTRPLVLTEVSLFFCLKLLDAQGVSNEVSDKSQNQIGESLQLHRTVYYSVSSVCSGSYTPHSVELDSRIFSILLKNDCNMSLVGEYEGFSIALDHLLSKEPVLKTKHIIGSGTDKQSIFIRNRFKFIFKSVVIQLLHLFESGKCLDLEWGMGIPMQNILIRGSDVKFHGLKITNFNNQLAEQNLLNLNRLIRHCCTPALLPAELRVALLSLLSSSSKKGPLDRLKELKDNSLWLRAEDRRMLLIACHGEFMTNYDIACEPDVMDGNLEDKSDVEEEFKANFFKNCPYIDTWKEEATDNEYLMQVANAEIEDAENSGTLDSTRGPIDQRTRKKLQMSSRSKHIKKKQKRRQGTSKGKVQFGFMRNFAIHMPEKAKKDGIVPFRMGLADYILTSYYPLYLPFVHGKISWLLKRRKLKRKHNTVATERSNS